MREQNWVQVGCSGRYSKPASCSSSLHPQVPGSPTKPWTWPDPWAGGLPAGAGGGRLKQGAGKEGGTHCYTQQPGMRKAPGFLCCSSQGLLRVATWHVRLDGTASRRVSALCPLPWVSAMRLRSPTAGNNYTGCQNCPGDHGINE